MRRELVDYLINEREHSPEILLESLVAALSEHEALNALIFICRVEDWREKIDDYGNVTDTETDKIIFKNGTAT